MIQRILYRLHLVHSPSRHLTVSCWCQKRPWLGAAEEYRRAIERGEPH